MKANASTGAVAVVGIVYGALALYLLAQQQWLDAALWLLAGGGLALSVTSTPGAWQARPRWLRFAAIAATTAALILFVVRVALDWRG